MLGVHHIPLIPAHSPAKRLRFGEAGSGNPALGPRWSLHSGRRSRTRVRGRAENGQHRATQSDVMAGLVPAIHVFSSGKAAKTWMPATSPGMTTGNIGASPGLMVLDAPLSGRSPP